MKEAEHIEDRQKRVHVGSALFHGSLRAGITLCGG
jgi:hypothetical protein